MKRLREGFLAAAKNNPKAEMPFLEHLEEMRWRILWSLLALVLGLGAGIFSRPLLRCDADLLSPGREILGEDWMPQALGPNENFFFLLRVAIWIGLVLASPTLVYHGGSFCLPRWRNTRSARSSPPSTWASCSSSRGWRWRTSSYSPST